VLAHELVPRQRNRGHADQTITETMAARFADAGEFTLLYRRSETETIRWLLRRHTSSHSRAARGHAGADGESAVRANMRRTKRRLISEPPRLRGP